ncbi:MAG: hypothetical protein IJI37_02270 [Opitutales bacterium]|nr:hypothetical protein [Opitutales bacterium]
MSKRHKVYFAAAFSALILFLAYWNFARPVRAETELCKWSFAEAGADKSDSVSLPLKKSGDLRASAKLEPVDIGKGKIAELELRGEFSGAEVFVNSVPVRARIASAGLACAEVSQALVPGKENFITVCLSPAAGGFAELAGAKVVVKNGISVDCGGVAASVREVGADFARVAVSARIANRSGGPEVLSAHFLITNARGSVLAKREAKFETVGGSVSSVSAELKISGSDLPGKIFNAEVSITRGTEILDSSRAAFEIKK